MHRIDTAGAVSGLFVDGDPTTATPSTIVDAAFMNAFMEELVNVVEAAGLTLTKADHTQLLQAYQIFAQGRLNTPFRPRAATPTANMTVVVEAGFVMRDGSLTEVAQQVTPTFTAPGSNSRIDRIVVDRLTGALSVVPGIAAATPAAPAIPTGKNPIARVTLTSGQSSITNASIADERAIYSMGLGLAAFGGLGSNVTIVGGNLVSQPHFVGQCIDFPATKLPSAALGWGTYAWSEGQSYLRATYPVLFDYYGTIHGAGNTPEEVASGDYFCVQDRRGLSPRGYDGTAGRDPDRLHRYALKTGGATGNNVGSYQDDKIRSHKHETPFFGSDGALGIYGATRSIWISLFGQGKTVRTGRRIGDSGASSSPQTGLLTSPQTDGAGNLKNEGDTTDATSETRAKNFGTRWAVRIA